MFMIVKKLPNKPIQLFGPFVSPQVAQVYQGTWIPQREFSQIVKVTEVHGIWQKESATHTAEALKRYKNSGGSQVSA